MKLGLCFAMLAAGCVPSSVSAAPKVEALRDLTVALVHKDVGLKSYCAGVWVSAKLIATAAHCVEGESEISYVTHKDVFGDGEVELDSGTPRPAVVWRKDEEHDVALLSAGNPPSHPVAVFAGVVHVGDRVASVGHGLGLTWTHTTGEITGIRWRAVTGPSMRWVQADVPLSPGCSGGGLFDAQGRLVGIASGSFPRGQLVNFFSDVRYLKALVSR